MIGLLRAVWLALGAAALCVLPATYAGLSLAAWGLSAAVPWVLGARLLFGPRAIEMGVAMRRLLDERAGVAAVAALGALLLLAGWLLAPVAMLWIATAAGAAALAAARWTPHRLALALPRLALAAVSLALCGAVVEAILRLPVLAEQLGTAAQRARDTARYDRLWERNLLGFRTPYEPAARDDGALRVLALGDSFTWGEFIASSADTWPARLEAQLSRRSGGAAVEVVNLAQRGFTTANQAELLRRLGWSFGPDLLLVQFFVNDVLPSRPDLGREHSDWLFPQHALLPASWRSGRIRDSALLELVERAYSRLRNRGRPTLLSLYRDDFEGWQQLRAALHEMGEAARERGVPAALLIFPRLHPGVWSDAGHPDAAVHQRVADAARAAGFRVLDLTRAFADAGGDARRWWVRPYDAHPGKAAHALAAERVATWLDDWLDVESNGPGPAPGTSEHDEHASEGYAAELDAARSPRVRAR